MRRCLSLAPLLALALASPAVVPRAAGQEETEPPLERLEPVGVITFAGVERARADIDFMFSTVEREDMSEVVDGYLEFVNNLEGVDRTRPFGVMVFLKPGFVPIPSPVGFLPISDLADFRGSLSTRPNVTTEMLTDDLMEVKGGFTLFVKLQDDYALISNERPFLEERILPNPLNVAGPLAARYDFAAQALPKNIPPGMRKLFQNLLRQNTQTQMQRRDDEPEAAFRVRKNRAKRTLEQLEALLEGSDEITLGIDASAERRTIEVDLAFEAVPGTAWEEELARIKARPTAFDVLYEEAAPLSLVAGLTYNSWDQAATIEQLRVAQDELGAALSGLRPLGDEEPARIGELEEVREAGTSDYTLIDPATRQLTNDVFEPLIVTVENGELNFFTQVRRRESTGMMALGGMTIAQGDRFSQGVPQVLERLLDKLPENNPLVQNLTLNVAAENGVTWHRFDVASDGDRATAVDATEQGDDEPVAVDVQESDRFRFFGGQPAIHVGLGRQHVWAVIGAEGSLEEAMAAVEAVQATAGRLGVAPEAPVRGAVNVNGWFSDNLDEVDDAGLRARDAFADGSDRLLVRFGPTPSGGGRLRLVFGEGFIRFLALSLTDRYDESQL
ncbi:hypothetical protein [Alienimonas californiensis]|uniref:Uncharacterized protein n=1 Tax=Alienimonas californiensis TaxID=2527989 RepID=A0A517PDV9_9PLAN|nr:hypothetical protein [Alienimonas californiensis]QDT17560.1 hypothetical protein CA12_36880 [Alienimonas californiensis]